MKTSGQPTINDVARIAGVSKKTVSRVINRSPLLGEETRQRIEDVIRMLGYVPNVQARALALRRNFLIALVHDNPNAQTVMNIQRGMLEALHGTDFEMVVRPIDRASPTMFDDLRQFLERQRPHGIVLMPPVSENDGVARLCTDVGCRYVRIGAAPLGDGWQTVASNDRAAVYDATRYLIAHGHRRIALVGGPHGFLSAHERRAGFEQALREARLDVSESLYGEGSYTFESGLAVGERLLDVTPRPTAIFSCNDEMAAGVMLVARRRGIDIPRELSIIGFDDTPIAAHVWPPLTTVRWPSVAMARAAARRLIDPVGEDVPVPEGPGPFPAQLIERESVAQAPN